jgi:hypothetical protein
LAEVVEVGLAGIVGGDSAVYLVGIDLAEDGTLPLLGIISPAGGVGFGFAR